MDKNTFGALQNYREQPIPNLDTVRAAKKGYRQHPLNTALPQAQEPWEDIRTQGIAGKNHYHRADNPPYYQSIPGSIEELHLRKSVAAKLIEVNKELLPSGLELFVHDAWRPAVLQYQMRNVWFADVLRARHPEWDDARVEEEVSNYWALAVRGEEDIDPESPPPHATGGALDLTIRWISREPLWMGTIFDDVTARAHTDALEHSDPGSELSFSDEEARMNRRLLYWLMKGAGFANNPTEWWHYSLGDQMWAKLMSAETGEEISAYYSNIDPAAR